ncbi:MAG: hypothetical protein LBS95_02570 [Mycoplasmataceae bacterium]|jgi:hypothetical protein|nr:hypothetical protein [Mycoplasmataceae bacterium]
MDIVTIIFVFILGIGVGIGALTCGILSIIGKDKSKLQMFGILGIVLGVISLGGLGIAGLVCGIVGLTKNKK